MIRPKKELAAFSAKIKQLRKEHNFTQLELASEIDVDVKTIKNIESGVYNPTLALVVNLAKAFKCEVKDLF